MLKLHDLYGQSYAHEFQFTNPDSIKNAVKRYNLQRAAERDENRKDKDVHKLCKPRFCKMRNNGHDVLGMVKSRDLDVETIMSNVVTSPSCTSHTSSNGSGARTSSEPNCAKAVSRLTGGATASVPRVSNANNNANNNANTNANTNVRSKKFRQRKRKIIKQKPAEADSYLTQIEGLHRQVCAELHVMGQQEKGELKGDRTKRKLRQPKNCKKQVGKLQLGSSQPAPSRTLQRLQLPPAGQKISSKISEHDRILQRLKQVLSVEQHHEVKHISYEDCHQPQAQWVDIIPSPIEPQVMQVSVCEGLNSATPSAACLYMDQNGSVEQDPLQPPYVEDSDLEQEYADRPGYLRYIERLPYTYSDLDATKATGCNQRELNLNSYWISLQRCLKPMQYTSQRSDADTYVASGPANNELTTEHTSNVTLTQAIETLCNRRPKPIPAELAAAMQSAAQAQRGLGSQTPKLPQAICRRKLKRNAQAGLARQPGGRDREQLPAVVPSAVTESQPTMMPPTVYVPKRRKVRPVVCTRSLENLKYQKMSIYNKISMTQERIITALDRLQCSLLKLQMPTCSNQEKQRRERKAFEFGVRFSRNCLYPLRGMIEDVRGTPVASYNSATSNEASQRVVGVYALMLHSIGQYQRQLRYFLVGKVPQKLSALIEMMYTLTNVCLEKSVLDRQDPVVECLQQRCTSFLTFIEDMQEQRFQLARETYRRMKKRVHIHGHVGGGGSRPDMHERYDLKMFLNDLKLYEPRLVPKERVDKRRRGWIRKPKVSVSPSLGPSQIPPTYLHSESKLDKLAEEVPTHIECVQCGDCRGDPSSEFSEQDYNHKQQMTNILALLKQRGQEKHELHRQLLEAMQHVTKSQVRAVLDRLVSSLGAMLEKKLKPNENE